MHSFKKNSLIASLLLFTSLSIVKAEPIPLTKQNLTINHQLLVVEVAKTIEQRQQGLMDRKHLPEGQGMLFDFEEEVTPCFWMKNTYLHLSLAFIDKNGQITQIEPLAPQDLRQVCSNTTIRYALEVPEGWLDKKGIKVGMYIKGINHL